MGGIKINSSNTLKYLGLKFLVQKKMFVTDVKCRILKFNAASFDILVKAEGLYEIVICEIIAQKRFSVLPYSWCIKSGWC